MSQKGFSNILLVILVIVIVVLVGTLGYFAFVKKSEPVAQQPTPTPKDDTASWNSYTYNAPSESGILPSMTFRYPSLFGNNPTLISSRITNPPQNFSEDWAGFVEFNPTGAFGDRGLRIEFFKKTNSEANFESYVSKSATAGGWASPKYFQAGSYRVARIRFASSSHYDADVGWYFIELGNKNILAISTSGDKKFLYDDDKNGNSTRDKIISTLVISPDPVIGRKCGGGVMGNGGACPTGYTCKITNPGPPSEGTCAYQQ